MRSVWSTAHSAHTGPVTCTHRNHILYVFLCFLICFYTKCVVLNGLKNKELLFSKLGKRWINPLFVFQNQVFPLLVVLTFFQKLKVAWGWGGGRRRRHGGKGEGRGGERRKLFQVKKEKGREAEATGPSHQGLPSSVWQPCLNPMPETLLRLFWRGLPVAIRQTLFYCVSQMLHFSHWTSVASPLEPFSHSICSLHVSVLHFGDSLNTNFFIITRRIMVTSDQWSLTLPLQPEDVAELLRSHDTTFTD